MNNVADYLKTFRSAKADTPHDVQRALDVDDRSRTSVLPWKGQFSPQLIEYLLGRHQGQRILDPFCGSGTVLYEAAAHGRPAVGIDVNPAAVVLAGLAHFCMMRLKDRLDLVQDLKQTVLVALARYNKDILELDFCQSLPQTPLYRCFLLLLFGDKKEVPAVKVPPTYKQLAAKMTSLPVTARRIEALAGDARYTSFENCSFDLVVTSPPYINVFNYHQNYRPVMESLGFAPLSIAKTVSIGFEN